MRRLWLIGFTRTARAEARGPWTLLDFEADADLALRGQAHGNRRTLEPWDKVEDTRAWDSSETVGRICVEAQCPLRLHYVDGPWRGMLNTLAGARNHGENEPYGRC